MFRYGKERGMIRAWDLQVIPALVAPLALISLAFTRWAFISLLGLYVLLVVIMALKVAAKQKDMHYLATIPVIYIAEHVSYALGFWRGLIFPRKIVLNQAEEKGHVKDSTWQ
jgi:hypothetical protein